MTENNIRVATNHSFNIAGRRLPMGAIYTQSGGAYYLVTDFRPFYAVDHKRRDKTTADPLTTRNYFYIDVLKPRWPEWHSFRVSVDSSFGRLIMSHMLEYFPISADSTIRQTVNMSVHDRRVPTPSQRPSYGQREHRSRFYCTEQRVPTSLIGTGIKLK